MLFVCISKSTTILFRYIVIIFGSTWRHAFEFCRLNVHNTTMYKRSMQDLHHTVNYHGAFGQIDAKCSTTEYRVPHLQVTALAWPLRVYGLEKNCKILEQPNKCVKQLYCITCIGDSREKLIYKWQFTYCLIVCILIVSYFSTRICTPP